MPGLPANSGEFEQNPMSAYLGDVYTVGVNLAGLPGISVPCGSIGSLKAGMQIIGKPFAESGLFQIAETVEKLAD